MRKIIKAYYKWKEKEAPRHLDVLDRLLYVRNIKSAEEKENYLNPTLDKLHSPYALKDMQKAVDRILEAKLKNEQLMIYGDYDVDGMTSAALLYLFFKRLDYRVSYHIPNRCLEGYGLNSSFIEKLEPDTLIITVDTGMGAEKEIAYAKTLGIDVIVTDHHECQGKLPSAYAIINPKRQDDTYPFKMLAGVGVAFKLMSALAVKEQVQDEIADYMAFVGLGTIVDVVPLVGENRVLAYLGLKALHNTSYVGLRKLLLGLEEPLESKIHVTANKLAYQIGPKLNAIGRIGDAKLGVALLITTSSTEAHNLLMQLEADNKKRQVMENQMLLEAESYIQKVYGRQIPAVLMVTGKNWHEGIVGIVASRLMNKYQRPVIVLNEEEEVLVGSARSIEGVNIFELLGRAEPYLVQYGGHRMAAGLTLLKTKFEAFKAFINEESEKMHLNEYLAPPLMIDLSCHMDDLTPLLYEKIKCLEPHGMANEAPLFKVRARVSYIERSGLKGKHLKIGLKQQLHTLQAIGFDKGYLADQMSEGEEYFFIVEMVQNMWKGKKYIQLYVRDVCSVPEQALKSQYYDSLYAYLDKKGSSHEIKTKMPPKNKWYDAKIINVYTEQGLYDLIKTLKNHGKAFTRDYSLCYNKIYDANCKQTICINPLQKSPLSIDYEWDYKSSYHKAKYVNGRLMYHKVQLNKMIPTYGECNKLYKYLKKKEGHRHLTADKIIGELNEPNMTEYKLYKMFIIFKELGVWHYTLEEGQLQYELLPCLKVQLEKSKTYDNMQNFRRSILKIKSDKS